MWKPQISKSPKQKKAEGIDEERIRKLIEQHNDTKYYQSVKKGGEQLKPSLSLTQKPKNRSISQDRLSEEEIVYQYRNLADPRSKSKSKADGVRFQDEDANRYSKDTEASRSRSANKSSRTANDNRSSKDRANISSKSKEGQKRVRSNRKKPQQNVPTSIPIKSDKLAAAASKLNMQPNSQRRHQQASQESHDELVDDIIKQASQHHRKQDATSRHHLISSPNRSAQKSKSPLKQNSRENSPSQNRDFDTKYWYNRQKEKNLELREKTLVGLIYKDQLGNSNNEPPQFQSPMRKI